MDLNFKWILMWLFKWISWEYWSNIISVTINNKEHYSAFNRFDGEAVAI